MSATRESTGLPFNPDAWEEAIFAERFLYPLLTLPEAETFRAFGKMLFYRCLEYSGYVDHNESRVVSDLRGCARDLRLLERAITCIGQGFDLADIREPDRAFVLLAGDLAPRVGALAYELEFSLGKEASNG